jgi:hypothetical protein
MQYIVEYYTFLKESAMYSAIVIDEKSKSKLEKLLKKFPEFSDWKKFIHHMTVQVGNLEGGAVRSQLGKKFKLEATHIGYNDTALAVKVKGFLSKNDVPHITLAVNPDGGKPFHSNRITKWKSIASIDLKGTLKEIYA